MGGFYWIASYPKSGNTWMRLMLQSLLAGGAAVDFAVERNFAPLTGDATEVSRYLDIDAGDLTQDELMNLRPALAMTMAREVGEPLFRKVHDCWGRTPSGHYQFPPEVTLGSLYLVRDPRDVAVSLAHHIGGTVDEAIAFMADKIRVGPKRGKGLMMDQPLSSWSRHVTSWREADPAPRLIRYEDLLADPERWLTRAAGHCGIAASASAIAGAVAATQFKTLKAAEAAHGFEIGQAKGRCFFRRGESGGWRDTLTTKQSDQILFDHGEVMRTLAYI